MKRKDINILNEINCFLLFLKELYLNLKNHQTKFLHHTHSVKQKLNTTA